MKVREQLLSLIRRLCAAQQKIEGDDTIHGSFDPTNNSAEQSHLSIPQALAGTGCRCEACFIHMWARQGRCSLCRALISKLEKRNHPLLGARACDIMLADKHYAFAQEARNRILQQHPELAS